MNTHNSRVIWLDIALMGDNQLGQGTNEDRRTRRLRRVCKAQGIQWDELQDFSRDFGYAVTCFIAKHWEDLGAKIDPSIVEALFLKHPKATRDHAIHHGDSVMNHFMQMSEARLEVRKDDTTRPRIVMGGPAIHELTLHGFADWVNTKTPKSIKACEWCGTGFLVLRQRDDLRFCCTSCRGAFHNSRRKAA